MYYTRNAFSSVFLGPANRDMCQQMYDCLGLSVCKLPYFLEVTRYPNPRDYNNSAVHCGHRINLGFWEYLNKDPETLKVFNSCMQSLATTSSATESAGPYVFDKELQDEEVSKTDVLTVDIGGGRG